MLSYVEKRARKNVEKEAIKLLSSLEMSEFFTPFEVSYFSEFFFTCGGTLKARHRIHRTLLSSLTVILSVFTNEADEKALNMRKLRRFKFLWRRVLLLLIIHSICTTFSSSQSSLKREMKRKC